jgi:predicted  nucleic acid-binding Zn-ribbon protein
MLEDRIAQMKTDHARDTDNHRDKYDRQQERLNNSKNKVAAAVAELEPLKTTLKALTVGLAFSRPCFD